MRPAFWRIDMTRKMYADWFARAAKRYAQQGRGVVIRWDTVPTQIYRQGW